MAAKRVPPKLPLPVRRAMFERLFAQMVDRVLAKRDREEAVAKGKATPVHDGA